MTKLSPSALPRISLSDQSLTLGDGRASTTIGLTLPGPEDLILAVDIYGFQPQTHPENHLGWWHFNPGAGTSALRLEFDFDRINSRSVRLFKNGVELAPPAIEPQPRSDRQELELGQLGVARRRIREVVEREPNVAARETPAADVR